MGSLESTMERLAEAQLRTEDRMEELAEAQHQTNANVAELSKNIDSLRKQVGGLSDAFGGEIEDIAYILLHRVLNDEFGWQVGVLERKWQTWGKEPEEVNIFGQASDSTRPDKTIWIVGEAKHNLIAREVEHFIDQVKRAQEHLVGEVFPVCFCYRARPEVQEMVQKAGIRLVYSYGKLV